MGKNEKIAVIFFALVILFLVGYGLFTTFSYRAECEQLPEIVSISHKYEGESVVERSYNITNSVGCSYYASGIGFLPEDNIYIETWHELKKPKGGGLCDGDTISFKLTATNPPKYPDGKFIIEFQHMKLKSCQHRYFFNYDAEQLDVQQLEGWE